MRGHLYTAPVREVIRDGENGRLVGFFEVEQIAEAVQETLSDRGTTSMMRQTARMDASKFSLNAGVNGYDKQLKPSALKL